MSKFSIYSKSWMDLVFENKNQNYGAFQLRQKSDETTLLAFCLGLTVVAMLLTIPMLISSFNSNSEAVVPTYDNVILKVSNLRPTPPQVPKQALLPIKKSEPKKEPTRESLTNPEIVKPQNVTTENKTPTTNTSNTTPTDDGKGGKEGVPPNGEGEKGKSSISTEILEDELNTTVTVDKMPEFPGGLSAFYTYVGEKFEAYDIDKTISVYLSFVIEKDGSMTDIKVLRSATPSIDKEAIRVLKSLRTKWKPGVKDGQNVRTLYRLPIKVKKQ